ncbi:MAG TPA: glycosyltransferase [Gemmatimonadaceae bacterium]|nr:glycosyltransferase [Gemmatimonadaceae bacterium]
MRPVGLLLTRNLLTGGAERVLVSYANHARGIRPVVGLLEKRGALLGELHPPLPCLARVDGTVPPSWGARIAPEIPGETFVRLAMECLWLRDVVRATGAAVVSSFLMRAHIVALLTKLVLLPRLPVVLNVHEHMTESAPHLYPKRRDRFMMRWITRHLFPRADRIVVVAEALKRDLVERHGVPAAIIEVVYNPLDIGRIRAAAGVGPDAVPREPARDGARPQVIVAVGRLVHLKGYDLLLHALARLRRSRDVRLVIVGEGPEREPLEQLARQLQVLEHVTFIGGVTNPWRYMAQGDVLALTSRTEAFPNVLGEAMALGVPVLSTDCTGGIRECLQDGACGLIVPPEDVGAMAEGLERLLGDAALRARLAAAGTARIAEFDLPTVQARYESVLSSVLAPPRA